MLRGDVFLVLMLQLFAIHTEVLAQVEAADRLVIQVLLLKKPRTPRLSWCLAESGSSLWTRSHRYFGSPTGDA